MYLCRQKVNESNYGHRRTIRLWTLLPKGEQSDCRFVADYQSGGVNLLRWILRELKDLSSHLICIANNPIGPEELPAEVMRTDWDGALCLIVKCPTSDII